MANTFIDIGKIVPVFTGDYSPSRVYEFNDLVRSNNIIYWHVERDSTVGVQPPAAGVWMKLLTSGGEGGGGSNVHVDAIQTEGTHIADITVDGEVVALYAPEGAMGEPVTVSETETGDILIKGQGGTGGGGSETFYVEFVDGATAGTIECTTPFSDIVSAYKANKTIVGRKHKVSGTFNLYDIYQLLCANFNTAGELYLMNFVRVWNYGKNFQTIYYSSGRWYLSNASLNDYSDIKTFLDTDPKTWRYIPTSRVVDYNGVSYLFANQEETEDGDITHRRYFTVVNDTVKVLDFVGNPSDGYNTFTVNLYSIGGGGGSATDVQINGTSITENGVANIPVASANDYGVVKAGNSAFGINKNSSGVIYVANASDAEITARTSEYKPVTPSNLNHAVTAVLTDGKAPALSDAQKAQAQSWLGIDTILGLVEAVSEVVG